VQNGLQLQVAKGLPDSFGKQPQKAQSNWSCRTIDKVGLTRNLANTLLAVHIILHHQQQSSSHILFIQSRSSIQQDDWVDKSICA
jgi:hypothetical protein